MAGVEPLQGITCSHTRGPFAAVVPVIGETPGALLEVGWDLQVF